MQKQSGGIIGSQNTERNEEIRHEQKRSKLIAKKIRSRYTEKQSTELDALRKLDAKVKRPASIYAYVFGSISALVMGAGMSLVLTDIGGMLGMEQPLIPGIVVGAVGLVLALLTYPVYKRVLGNRKKKYAPEILALSEKIMNQ